MAPLRGSERDGRRWLADGLLLALALVVLVVVVKTLRQPYSPENSSLSVISSGSPTASTTPTPAPVETASPSPSVSASASASPAAPEPRGAVAAGAGVALRWTGTSCPAPGRGAAIQRSTDGGASWVTVGSPFAVVSEIVLAGTAGLARGLDDSCEPVAATTSDGGKTWAAATLPGGTTSVDVVGGGGRWAVVGGSVRRAGVVVPDPCKANTAGTPSLVRATTADAAWLLCQDSGGGRRLLLRTTDGGKKWQRLAGRRPETGLAGKGVVAAMDFPTASAGWVLIRGAGCAEGELRITTTGGAGWTTLPCVRKALSGVREVLSVSFADTKNALAVVVSGGRARLLRSKDSGRTWTLVPG